MIRGRLAARYRRLWLRGVYRDAEGTEAHTKRLATMAFADAWFGPWYPFYLCGLVTVGAIAIQAEVGLFAALLIGRRFGLALFLVVMSVPLVLAAIAAADLVGMLVMRPFVHRQVRRSMVKLGLEVCMRCGYVQQGLPSSVTACPECGAARDARFLGHPPLAPDRDRDV